MTGAKDPQTADWHLDKRVNVSVVVTLCIFLLVQTTGGAWFASALNESVKANKSNIETAQRDIVELRTSQRLTRDDLTGRMIRVEEKLSQQSETLQRILTAVEQNNSPK